ncbi:MAG TPA: AAA family ATPase, partial [Gaiella sp.]|nr:AAA family ATPase [Gaiella sp.]
MARKVIGREGELACVRSFVDGAAARVAALVLEGDAGIGKSTLWLAGVEHARSGGLRVLRSRPAEAELGLAYVGLGDLLEDVLDDVLPALSPPRRRALEVALVREEEAGKALDPRTLGIATRDALQLLARDRRLLVAIDDVQWLDDASARALAFALRRVDDENVLVLLARRAGPGRPTPGVEGALDAERLQRLPVGPLSLGAIQRIFQARLGRQFPRPTLLRLHEASGGNPFYALELARALDAEGAAADPTEPLPVPETLEWIAQHRLTGLTETTREALSLVAAAGRPTPAMLRAAGVADDVLAPAFAARIVEDADGTIRFTHPLVGSALYRALPVEERQRAHRLLSAVSDDALARSRHLALASEEPDADVAAALDDAASLASSRDASVTASELAAHALRLTPPDAVEDRHRRGITAARMQLLAGDGRRAGSEANELLTAAASPRQRAEALVLLSDIEQTGALERAVALRREALAEADSHPGLEASIHEWLGDAVRRTEGLAVAEQHARAALQLADRLGDDALRARSLALLGILRFNAAEHDALELVEEAYAQADAAGELRARLEAAFALGHVLTWSGHLGRARALLEGLYPEVSERDERRSVVALWLLSLVELGAGRLALAVEHADRQRETSRLYAADDREDPLAIWVVARVAAHRGELDRARELAERSRALAHAQPVILAGQEAVLGLVEDWSGKPREAVARFAAAEQGRSGADVRDPSHFWWRAEYAEALLALGRTGAAVDLLDTWEADAARLGRERVLADVARCR